MAERQRSPNSEAQASRLREATELQPQVSASGGQSLGSSSRAPPADPSLLGKLRAWRTTRWKRHVSVLVSHRHCRDHLGSALTPVVMSAANERTFLGMLRTSLAFAVTGTLVAQLMRLEHSSNPDPVFGFYVLGVPLAAICICCALLVAMLGCIRFLRQQDAIIRQKCLAGGWEMYTTGCLALMTLVVSFTLIVSADVKRGWADQGSIEQRAGTLLI